MTTRNNHHVDDNLVSAMEGISMERSTSFRYEELGPPSSPLAFDAPILERGRRDQVLCYIPATGSHQVFKNVLFRNPHPLHKLKQAYWPVPEKSTIKTIMGHVEICLILERCIRQREDDESFDDDSENDDDDDEEIVFELTDRMVAVKVNYIERIERLKTKHAEDPMKEISAMQLAGNNHPNVLGLVEVLFDGRNVNCVLRYCDSGDLFQLLQESQPSKAPQQQQQQQPGQPEPVARYWFRQLVEGVKYIHSRGICHRDLSPENVMIDKDGCLIIDFGMCLRMPYLENDHAAATMTDVTRGTRRCLMKPQGACGKLPYMSPEIFKNREPFDGELVDVWTLGTILFCMLTGNRSYQQPHPSDAQFYWMTHGLPQLLADWSVSLSSDGVDLLQQLLQINPRLRINLAGIERHP
ncbi:hypothetical protein MPSEU_000144000 [Mayamaea pseudoterrestris]|nr:hypothetical protein MPSEU_000144000 [Mayamaea pseudoterrestris]